MKPFETAVRHLNTHLDTSYTKNGRPDGNETCRVERIREGRGGLSPTLARQTAAVSSGGYPYITPRAQPLAISCNAACSCQVGPVDLPVIEDPLEVLVPQLFAQLVHQLRMRGVHLEFYNIQAINGGS